MTIQESLEQGWQQQRAGQLVAAEEIYRRILQAQPDHPEALYLLGTVCQRQGKLDEAAQHLLTAVSVKPDYVDAHNNLGVVLAAMGRRIDATAHFRHVVRLRPDDADAANNLGNALREQGELAEAEERLRIALRLRPDFPPSLHNLGLTLARQGKLGESVAALEQAIRLRPDFTGARADLAIVLDRMKRELGPLTAVRGVAIEVSPGELLDRITVLQIKNERIADQTKLQKVRAELELLSIACEQIHSSEKISSLVHELKAINEAIWEAEDALRVCERDRRFDEQFVDRARSVYRNNDRRAAIKRAINEQLAAPLGEVKEYPAWGSIEPSEIKTTEKPQE